MCWMENTIFTHNSFFVSLKILNLVFLGMFDFEILPTKSNLDMKTLIHHSDYVLRQTAPRMILSSVSTHSPHC